MANPKTNHYTENNTRLGSCRSLTFCHVPKGAGFFITTWMIKMGKDPAVLFYTGDFLAGVSFFNKTQIGEYITLLCEQHQLGHIPENHMISVCGSLDSPVVKKFTVDEDGNYYNKRMEEEAIKRANYCKSRSNPNAGRKKKKSYDKSYDKSYENHTENENRNENKDKRKVFTPPTIEEVKAYLKEKGYTHLIDANKWWNHYNAIDWKIGKNKMKNWHSAIATWLPAKKDQEKPLYPDL